MWWWLTNEWVWKIPFEFKILILDFAIFQELSSFIHFNWWIQIMIIIVFNLVPQYLPYMDILHQEFANYNCKTIKYLDRFSDVYVVEMTFEGWFLSEWATREASNLIWFLIYNNTLLLSFYQWNHQFRPKHSKDLVNSLVHVHWCRIVQPTK